MSEDYIQKISNFLMQHGKIDYAFLFGSFLKHPLPDSDVDILLGASLDATEKPDLAMELELILKRKVDLSPEDKKATLRIYLLARRHNIHNICLIDPTK